MSVSIRLKIKSMYSDLSAKEQVIADCILEHPEKVSHSSISELSSELGIADSTVFQFTRKLGYSGFKDFKIDMIHQTNDFSALSIHENIQREDDELATAKKIFDSNVQALYDTLGLLAEKNLREAVDIIEEANRVFFFGVGGSEIVAADAHHKFLRSSIFVNHSSDSHIQLMESSLMREGDVAFLISHTGKSKEIIAMAETAKENGAKIIVITSQAQSPLAKMSDVTFISLSEEIEFRSEALSSRISQLSIIDSLYVALMFRNQEKSEQAISNIRRAISKVKD